MPNLTVESFRQRGVRQTWLTVLAVAASILLLIGSFFFRDFLGAVLPLPNTVTLVRYVDADGRHCYSLQEQADQFCEQYGFQEDLVLGTIRRSKDAQHTIPIFSCSRAARGELLRYDLVAGDDATCRSRRMSSFQLGYIIPKEKSVEGTRSLLQCRYTLLPVSFPETELTRIGDPLLALELAECAEPGYSNLAVIGKVEPVAPSGTAAPSASPGVIQPGGTPTATGAPQGSLAPSVSASPAVSVLPSPSPTIPPQPEGEALHVLYCDSTRKLTYAAKQSDQWTSEQPLGIQYCPTSHTLSVDSSGLSHVAYAQPNGSIVHAVRQDPEDWQGRPINEAGSSTLRTAVKMDATIPTDIWIAFYDNVEQLVQVLRGDGTTWSLQPLDLEGVPRDLSEIRADGSGQLHLAYTDSSNDLAQRGLHHVAVETGGLSEEAVEGGVLVDSVSLALDTQSKLHLAYETFSFTDDITLLKYAIREGDAWQTETVGTTGSRSGCYSVASIADSAGRTHIAFHDRERKSVKYATNASGAWAITEIEAPANQNEQVGCDALAIALDGQNAVHLVYDHAQKDSQGSWTSSTLKHAMNISGQWASENIGRNSRSAAAVSIGE